MKSFITDCIVVCKYAMSTIKIIIICGLKKNFKKHYIYWNQEYQEIINTTISAFSNSTPVNEKFSILIISKIVCYLSC